MAADRGPELSGEVESPLAPVETRTAERPRRVSDAARAVREDVDARAAKVADAALGHEPGVVVDLAARFAGRAEVTVSHPQFIEFLAPGVSKGRAVRWFGRRTGVPLEHACGGSCACSN